MNFYEREIVLSSKESSLKSIEESNSSSEDSSYEVDSLPKPFESSSE